MTNFTEQLAPYGYSVDGRRQILSRHGAESGVFLTRKRGRMQARRADGTLLWSGQDAGDFVAWFWCAKKIG